jgi:hypothetical protein
MTVTNHAITAANLSLAVQKWWILPVAFASHFVIDFLPHYGEKPGKRGKRFISIQLMDAILLLMVIWLAVSNPANNNTLVWVAMVLAILPDSIWVYRFIREQKSKINAPVSIFSKLHSKFNWQEKNWGWVYDIGWFLFMLVIFVGLVPL